MKDELGAVGVSGRDPADDDDDYTLELLKIGTIMYLTASTRSQVATAQHGDHGFPKCRILCPDIRDMFSSALPPFQKDVTTRNHTSSPSKMSLWRGRRTCHSTAKVCGV